ncbi:hypothetical protein, partial [Hymenobacter coalescens]
QAKTTAKKFCGKLALTEKLLTFAPRFSRRRPATESDAKRFANFLRKLANTEKLLTFATPNETTLGKAKKKRQGVERKAAGSLLTPRGF